VDVILDKWDLKEGHDAHAFMEKMVTDSKIKKVAIICDKAYAEKADVRKGGVGTETQIISPEIYAKQDQTKFVAILPERDEKGNPYLPIYYKSRVYIDLSTPELYGRNFEQLLRWIYDKPRYEKPELGKKPAFLEEESGISLQTTTKFRRALDAIRESRPYWQGALSEYFETFTENLERFRIEKKEKVTEEFDELVVKNLEQFLPYRNEAIEIFKAIARYQPSQESWAILHRFFEGLIPYLSRPIEDNFKFIIHELFLYAITALNQSERFDGVAYLMRQNYYIEENTEYGKHVMAPYSVFRPYLNSLEYRNKRLKLNRISLHADLINSRSKTSGFTFQQVMQSDFLLYIRWCVDFLRNSIDRFDYWWPETLVYSSRQYGPFEVFARSQSQVYFKKFIQILDIEGKDNLLELINAIIEGKIEAPKWHTHRVNPSLLMGIDKIGTLP